MVMVFANVIIQTNISTHYDVNPNPSPQAMMLNEQLLISKCGRWCKLSSYRSSCISATWPPGTHLTNTLWAYHPNFVIIHIAFTWKIILWSHHNFTHVTTAQLSWHVQNCDLIGWLESILEKRKLAKDFSYRLMNHRWHGHLIHLGLISKSHVPHYSMDTH